MRILMARFRASAILCCASLLAGASSVLLGTCGPFTDVAADSFCPFVAEIFYLGITTGTTPTTYNPAGNVSRLQMAAFLSRTVDGALRRGSRRAVLKRFWVPGSESVLDVTTVGSPAAFPACDGLDIWVPSGTGSVTRVRSNDGGVLGTWTGAPSAYAALPAIGKIFVTGYFNGNLYRIDPRLPPGAVTTVASNLNAAIGLTFDGTRIWITNSDAVSIVTPGPSIPWTVTTVTTGFSNPTGILFDGFNVWVSEVSGRLKKLDSTGGVLQTVTIGSVLNLPAFDGANIWVPGHSPDVLFVVRAATGVVLATITGNGLANPQQAAFDGERVLVTNRDGPSVSLWKAGSAVPLGSLFTGVDSDPIGACSDGVDFWFTFRHNQLARF